MSSNSKKFNSKNNNFSLLREKISTRISNFVDSDGDDTIKFTVRGYKVRIAALATAATLLTGIVAASIPGLAEDFNNTSMITRMTVDFRGDVLSPETHRTDNGEYYYYDYDDILARMLENYDLDEAIYLLYKNVGLSQTDRVLSLTPYESFTKYLEVKGYEDAEDFENHIRQQIIKKNELNKLSDERDSMRIELLKLQNEHVSELDARAKMH